MKTGDGRALAGKETLRQRDNGQKGGRGWCREGKRNGLAIRLQNPEPQGAREAETPLDVVVGGVLIKKTQETCAGADGGIRKTDVGAVKAALRGVRGIVAGVAEPGHAKGRDQRGLIEPWNLIRWDVQIGYDYFAKRVPVKQRADAVDLIG